MADETNGAGGRPDQRHRTRKDLLLAGSRLLDRGMRPSMAEVAREARVSRATAYRYFDSVDALLCEAPVDHLVDDPEGVLADTAGDDLEERVVQAEAWLHDISWQSAPQLRAMLAHTLRQSLARGERDVPLRQNRRVPLIEAALAPGRDRLGELAYERLVAALALVFGTESMIVCQDVLQLDEAAARDVKAWAVRALVRAAQGE